MYKPIKLMYIFLGVYLAVKILPLSKRLVIIMTSLLKSALVIFATNIINSTIFVKDSRFLTKKRWQRKNIKTLK